MENIDLEKIETIKDYIGKPYGSEDCNHPKEKRESFIYFSNESHVKNCTDLGEPALYFISCCHVCVDDAGEIPPPPQRTKKMGEKISKMMYSADVSEYEMEILAKWIKENKRKKWFIADCIDCLFDNKIDRDCDELARRLILPRYGCQEQLKTDEDYGTYRLNTIFSTSGKH